MTEARPPKTAEFQEPAHRQQAVAGFDLVLVGGGLANSLIALAVAARQPHLSIALIERGATIGGNHTWSFHTTDVDTGGYRLLQPMLEANWPDQEIRFPQVHRLLATGYNAMTSERLHAAIIEHPRLTVFASADAAGVTGEGVTLADGRDIAAHCVIDGRGAVSSHALALGFQKFVGLEVELSEPHGQTRPVIMDATVDQHDGYRFVYTLPFSPTRILIEDTYYSDGPELDVDRLAARAREYAAAKGWRIAAELRQEQGILPITIAGDINAFWSERDPGTAHSGMRACLFHPTTGYSLPDAMSLAQRIATASDVSTAAMDRLIRRHSTRCWQQRGFFRMLNRMLFLAAKGDERRAILERFYTLPAPLIERFYAARLTSADKARILLGRPPLPIPRAVQHLSERQAMAAFAARAAAGGSHG